MQNIGSLNTTDLGNIEVNRARDKMMYTNIMGLMEYYNFDRCTGIISNPQTLFPEQVAPFSRYFWDGQFSPSGDLFYTTLTWDCSYLVQYNLQAPNIPLSADTLWYTYSQTNQFGQLKLAPDNKIYLTTWYANGMQFPYPYADTMYNMYNMYLSVINHPDSLGAACDFQPYSFYLGGKRTYLGLPNNPDYDMPALAGSPCDTLTGLTPGPSPIERGAELFATWVNSWQKLFVNAQLLKGRMVTVEVFDVAGMVISASPPAPLQRERGEMHNGYFTQDIFLPNLAAGAYLVKLQTVKETLSKKFVVSE